MKALREILNEIRDEVLTLKFCKGSTICTYEDLLIRVSENKNEYLHVYIVYDLAQVTALERSQEIPFKFIVCDKLRTNADNKLHIHSNAASLSIEIMKVLSIWADNNLDEIKRPVGIDLWTDLEADALLAGTTFDLTLITNIGGYCEVALN